MENISSKKITKINLPKEKLKLNVNVLRKKVQEHQKESELFRKRIFLSPKRTNDSVFAKTLSRNKHSLIGKQSLNSTVNENTIQEKTSLKNKAYRPLIRDINKSKSSANSSLISFSKLSRKSSISRSIQTIKNKFKQEHRYSLVPIYYV